MTAGISFVFLTVPPDHFPFAEEPPSNKESFLAFPSGNIRVVYDLEGLKNSAVATFVVVDPETRSKETYPLAGPPVSMFIGFALPSGVDLQASKVKEIAHSTGAGLLGAGVVPPFPPPPPLSGAGVGVGGTKSSFVMGIPEKRKAPTITTNNTGRKESVSKFFAFIYSLLRFAIQDSRTD